MRIRIAAAASALVAVAVIGGTGPAVADDQPQGGGGNCQVKEPNSEYKYMVDTCQFLGQFGLNSLVHGAVLGKEAPAGEEPAAGE
ncbi:hypothetical protein [Streptomyces sp. ODS28]|uniref:hypothetical protein n=1 Tax=Streptomyces sp. ODS28 TaxID=3136688 RepID=UPI0031EC2305